MDRAYLDFERLYNLHQEKAFFISQAKNNFKFKRRYSHEVEKETGVQCDKTIILATYYPAKKYPGPLRRDRFYDYERQKRPELIAGAFHLFIESMKLLNNNK